MGDDFDKLDREKDFDILWEGYRRYVRQDAMAAPEGLSLRQTDRHIRERTFIGSYNVTLPLSFLFQQNCEALWRKLGTDAKTSDRRTTVLASTSTFTDEEWTILLNHLGYGNPESSLYFLGMEEHFDGDRDSDLRWRLTELEHPIGRLPVLPDGTLPRTSTWRLMAKLARLLVDNEKDSMDDVLQQFADSSYVDDGVVLGAFHERNEGTAIHNPSFRPFTSPAPFLLLRHAVNSDWKFFLDNEDWLSKWARRFGESAVQALAEDLRRTNWRRLE